MSSFFFPQEICVLFLATHLLGDHLSLLNWLGFAVCLSGISLHVILKAINAKGDSVLNDFLFLCRHPCSFTELEFPARCQCSGLMGTIVS